MSTLSADLEQAVRAIVRDEIERASGKQPVPTLPQQPSSECGVTTAAGTCHKPANHEGRHKYSPASVNPSAGVTPVVRNWRRERGFYKKSGTKHFLIEVGNPCRVEGERGLWKVVGVEFGVGPNEGKINVEVKTDRTGHSRTFPSDRIIYKRPAKVAS